MVMPDPRILEEHPFATDAEYAAAGEPQPEPESAWREEYEGVYELVPVGDRFEIHDAIGNRVCRVNDEENARALLAFLRGETAELPAPALRHAA